MDRKRRTFMAGFGVSLASFLTLGCRTRPPITSCYVPIEPTVAATPVLTPSVTCYTVVPVVTATATVPVEAGADWKYLRDLWFALDELAPIASDEDEGAAKRDLLVSEHEATLASLVSAGSVDAAVAEGIQAAYAEAAYHVWRSNTNMTCYEAPPRFDYTMQGRAELVRQAEILEEIAGLAALNEDTVAEARAAIERDLAYLTMSADEQDELVARIIEEAGESGDYPGWDEVRLDVSEVEAEAARVLVRLLLGRQ